MAENDESGMEQTQVSKADLEAMQAKIAAYDRLVETAKQVDMETPEELVEEMQTIIADLTRQTEQAAAAAPAASAAPASAAAPAAAPRHGEPTPKEPPADVQAQKLNALMRDVYLRADWANFRLEQVELPPDERVTFTKDELTKAINSEYQPIIVAKAQKEGKTLFAAAADVLSVTKGTSGARAEGAAAEAAKAAAAQTSGLPLGGRAAAPATQTPADAAKKYQEDMRNKLAPPDRKYEMPT